MAALQRRVMELEHKLSLTTAVDTNHSTASTNPLPTACTTVPAAPTTAPLTTDAPVAEGQVDEQEQRQGPSREVERDLREQLKRAWMTINEQDALVHQGSIC